MPHPDTPARAPLAGGLKSGQMVACLMAGAVLWLAAALLLGWLGPMGIHQDPARIALYLAVIPGTLPFVWLIARIARLAAGQVLPGLALALMAAMFLDGLALAWAPGLYGGEAYTAGAGSVILWGAAIVIAAGWAWDAWRLSTR